VGEDAEWRGTEMSHYELLAELLARGAIINPILQVPGVDAAIFRVDWLHSADQGVAADFLGCLFKLCATLLPGASVNARTRALWLRVVAFYEANDVHDRLPKLVPTAIQKTARTPPKLRGSAACVRALVPFGQQLADALLVDGDAIHDAAKAAAKHLAACYECLSQTVPDRRERMAHQCRAFSLQYSALAASSPDGIMWRVKPKLHIFQHLCEEHGSPSLHWTYRDEDYGGSIAAMARMRGRWHGVKTYSAKVIDLWCMKHRPPRIL
jgi:hypothetical protein